MSELRTCRIVLPVTLFDGSHPEDRPFLDFKFLVKTSEMKLPEEKSAMIIRLAGEGDKSFDIECQVADVTYIEDERVFQVLLGHRQLHVNWWRCGVADMFAKGWRWAKLTVIPPPQSPTY